MLGHSLLTLCTVVLLLASEARSNPDKPSARRHTRKNKQLSIDGYKLPKDFIYGCGTSAYQIEGAWNVSGKGESIWDHFAHDKGKGHIKDDLTGDVAVDFYHTYKDDLPLFKKALGINNYDFTISWTRILPKGTGSTPNEKGLNFYRRVAKTAKQNGMSASCTLYHWDLPEALQEKYQGWLSKDVVADFKNYARVTMEGLGDVCSRWISMNEPRTFCVEGYGSGESAPGLKLSDPKGTYTCMHHALLAHSAAHEVFQELKAEGKVHGTFGIKIDGAHAKPSRPDNFADQRAARRSMAFGIGWDLAPLTTGDYPPVMRKTMGDDLPRFTEEESRAIKDSYDIIYFDGYTSTYAQALEGDNVPCKKTNDFWPSCVNETNTNAAGHLIGKPTDSEWNFDVSDTLYEGLKYMHQRWGARQLAVGETGMVLKDFKNMTLAEQLHDTARVTWYRHVLHSVKRALQHNVPVVGLESVPWSCITNLEWSNGYEDFGLIYTTFGKDQPRMPKQSAHYLRGVLTEGQKL